MMVIGVDTHKSTHAMAAVAADTGLLASEREIAAAMTVIVRRSAGPGRWTQSGCGRSRTAGMSRGAWSRP